MTDVLLDALRRLTANPSAGFRDSQREAVEALVGRRERVLLVQRTGWGKSAVYFLATHLLRQQQFGPTLLISPLLALIRNQIDAAERLGLRSITVNTASDTTIDHLVAGLWADSVDLVLVSPERLANPEFADRVMPLLGRRPCLIVIDEAHCISDWGHDFRPDYRRLVHLIDGLGHAVPVLACTATANDRVVGDVAEQLGAASTVIRGPLARDGLALHVVQMPSVARRLAWLHYSLSQLPGTGIVYCLTVNDVERVSAWLTLKGHAVLPYTGGSDRDDRLAAEAMLQRNEVKALVATTALGMGYDKPDLGFVVHFQSPGSPLAYYQQVGRAGRQLDRSVGVLLCGAEDEEIQDWFIETAFPDPAVVDAVLAVFAIADGPVNLDQVMTEVNIKASDCDLVAKQLSVEGVLRRLKFREYERTLKPWQYPAERVTAVTAARRAEQEQMRSYHATDGCRMAFLTSLLDDPAPASCGVCDRCSGEDLNHELPVPLVAEAAEFLTRGHGTIEPRVYLEGRQRLAEHQRYRPGRVLCRWNDEGWGRMVAAGKRAGRFDEALVTALVEMVGEWSPEPAPEWLTFVPSLRAGDLVADLAQRFSLQLGVPLHPIVTKVRRTPPQKRQNNSAHQERNVRGAFALSREPLPSPVFLLDDLVDSRWTFTEVARLLLNAGSGPVYPLALASTLGRDS